MFTLRITEKFLLQISYNSELSIRIIYQIKVCGRKKKCRKVINFKKIMFIKEKLLTADYLILSRYFAYTWTLLISN